MRLLAIALPESERRGINAPAHSLYCILAIVHQFEKLYQVRLITYDYRIRAKIRKTSFSLLPAPLRSK
ncbi:hypothetical protein [Nostoc sp.]|uniref:hypothetical protein n=1 Tax=Nostoc sp. TaxID=1180 RepID=UPI002FFAAA1B